MNNDTKNQNGEIEIDLLSIFKMLKQRIWIIIASAILCSGIAYGYTYYFINPMYQASVMIYVNNSSISVGSATFSISDAQISAAKKLVDTYLVILKSRSTLEEVAKLSNLGYSYERLYGMISGGDVNSTEIFQISVTSDSPTEAALIANTIAQILPQRISGIVDGSSVKIVDYAVTPQWSISPSYTKNTSMGLIAGLVLSVAAIIIGNLLDTRIASKEYLTMTYDIPIIGIIPDNRQSDADDIYYAYYRSDKNSTAKTNSTPETKR